MPSPPLKSTVQSQSGVVRIVEAQVRPLIAAIPRFIQIGVPSAALKADGSITAWGVPGFGGTGAPADSGYTKIYSTEDAFAALKADGSITAWGNPYTGGIGAPSGKGYTKIYSSGYAFAALKADGSITAWGRSGGGGLGAPDDSGYTKIYSTRNAFTAVKADGSVTAWGGSDANDTVKVNEDTMPESIATSD